MVKKRVKKLIQRYQTNDPFKLSEKLDIEVRLEKLPKDLHGFYTKILGYEYIVINEDQSEKKIRAICAHELGHAVLHAKNKDLTLASSTAYMDNCVLEQEANIFAAHLLSYDNKPKNGETLDDYAERIDVPIETLYYLFF